MFAAFLTHVHVFGLYIVYALSLSTVRLGLICCLAMNCVTYSVLQDHLTCLISTRLNSPAKTRKIDINGPGKFWKAHIKRSWKVMKNYF